MREQDKYDRLAREVMQYLDSEEGNQSFRSHITGSPPRQAQYQQPYRAAPPPATFKPPKKRNKASPAQLALTLFLLTVFVISGGYLAKFYIIDPANMENDSQSLAQLYTQDEDSLPNDNGFNPEDLQSEPGEIPIDSATESGAKAPSASDAKPPGQTVLLPTGARDTFAKLYAANKDLVGWIKVPGTKINYPVVQTKDNTYYLTRDFYKKSNRLGAIFIETGQKVTATDTSRNLTIYGHNPKTTSMFGQLVSYRTLSFYKKNPILDFDTLYEDGQWKVFAAIITNAQKAEDNGNLFDWRQTDFTTEEEFNSFIEEIRKRSLYNTGVDVTPDDRMLSLTTCVYDFNEARLIVFARKLRPGESKTSGVSEATVNKTPLYPAAWNKANAKK